MKYVVALDQGTTSSRSIVFDEKMKQVSSSQKEFRQIYPNPGWVEHDPFEILTTQIETLRDAVTKAGISSRDIVAIGIANQRETTVVWDKRTGKPICNAIVWQCRRTTDLCTALKEDGLEDVIGSRTGLVVDAYFSGTKIRWMLDNIPGARQDAEAGHLLFGTIDSWLVWNLSAEKNHLTDVTNASRTMLFNIHEMKWDDELLRILRIPPQVLPEVQPCTACFGLLHKDILGSSIPLCGIAGDQQAALFGQACFRPGDAKNTYGTGCFLLMNTGSQPVHSNSRLLTTVAWEIGKGPVYALEGSVFMGGATIQWLRDEMGLIKTSSESETLANSISDTGGVYLVPAFAGLGAPWWDMYARGTIVGMTRGTGRAHIVRAALEAIAFQSADLISAMQTDSGIKLASLKVDGGASSNNFLMQFQANLLNTSVLRPASVETTAIGAACFAGLSSGVFSGINDLSAIWQEGREYLPSASSDNTNQLTREWHRAVNRAKNWIDE